MYKNRVMQVMPKRLSRADRERLRLGWCVAPELMLRKLVLTTPSLLVVSLSALMLRQASIAHTLSKKDDDDLRESDQKRGQFQVPNSIILSFCRRLHETYYRAESRTVMTSMNPCDYTALVAAMAHADVW
jgi:hypothetical protein